VSVLSETTLATAAVEPTPQRQEDALPRIATGVLIALCAAKLLLHVFTSVRHYGYFRDELYYLDMARHLDWGYVDAAPLGAVYAKIALLMGGSLAALRIIPALAGTALVALTILIARELGGGRFAQFLAALGVLLAPGFLVMDNLMTMNAFEPLFWMGCVLVVARILRTGNSRLWIWFGVLSGIGIENKHSTLIFGFALTIAVLLVRPREFLKPWIWIGGLIALALFMPNLIWQYRHHFPTIEDLQNVKREGKNVVLPLGAFIKQQVLTMQPIFFPVWLSGVCWLLWQRRWRLLGMLFVVFFVTMELQHAKDYYLFPIYPMAFAAGAVAIEGWTKPRAWLTSAVVLVLLAGALPIVPLAVWWLPPDQYVRYQAWLGIKPQKAETHHESQMMQPIADQFGWPELVKQVADVYNSLPLDQRAVTGIWAGNYGEAGAINLWGPQYGLPTAYSRHQNHWYWGPPPVKYQNLIVIQWSHDDVRDNCASYESFDHFNPYGMGEENTPFYLCRGVKFDIQKIWPNKHHWN
jgi:hypothetical protein